MKAIPSIRSLPLCACIFLFGAWAVFISPTASAATLISLASFHGTHGSAPSAGLIADADGNLYGTTYEGGASNLGTVFKFDPAMGAITTLASFDGSNGRYPLAGLIAGVNGNLYGTTREGGASDLGTVFKLDPATGTLTTLASFDGANGKRPYAGLIADPDGNLFGTTHQGGANNYGTVFKLDPATGALATLASFDGANSSNPLADLMFDAAGNLYGTTQYGGTSDLGTVFKLDPATGVLVTLVSFDGSNGRNPGAGLIADAAGKLYGTTHQGGESGYGTVFQLDPATGVLVTLVSFDGTKGSYPTAGLIADAAGNLYGTTYRVGMSGSGTVFQVNPITGILTTLASFNGANGRYPDAGLIADAAGNLYGTTYQGGTNNRGTVFKLTDTGFVVPEPASLLSLALGIAAMMRRRA